MMGTMSSQPWSPQPWRIKPVLPVTKLLGAVAVLVLVFAFGRDDAVQWFLASAVSAGLAGWAVRDLVAPIRLAADAEGVTVIVGYARRHWLPWAQIAAVRLDRHDRFGISSDMVEIDADDALYLFSMHDLGAEPRDVLAVLQQLHAQASHRSA